MRRTRASGLTLVEALIAALIVAIVVAAFSQAIVAGQMQTYDALHTDRAIALAETLMEEVLALPYADPDGATAMGPDSGEATRAAFDNIDDYHGYTEEPKSIANADSGTLPYEFQSFTRTVDVSASVLPIAPGSASVAGVTITVTVTDETGRRWTVTRFVAEPTE